MKNLIFVGTLHAGLTPHEELAEVLNQYKPEILLVEIVQEDLEQTYLDKYPDEMVFAFMRAKEKGIPVYGFDSSIDIFASGQTDLDNAAAIIEQKVVLEIYSWKDANSAKVNNMLMTPRRKLLGNPAKEKEREKEMLKHIKNFLIDDKKIVVVTGTGHLQYFQQHFPDALFPFR